MRLVTSATLGVMLLISLISLNTVPTQATPQSGILVNELLYDPLDTEVEHEWVELFNGGTQAINILNWTLSDNDGSVDMIFPDIEFPPGAFALVHTGQGANSSVFENGEAHFYMWKSSSMWSPTGDDVLLANETDVTMDFISYGQWNGSQVDDPPSDFTYTHSNASAEEGYSIALSEGGFRQSVPTPLDHNRLDEYKHLLITEVLYRPYGENEYIRLHNTLESSADVSYWYITDGEGVVAFPRGAVLDACGSIYIVQNSANFFIETLKTPDYEYGEDNASINDMRNIGTAPQLTNDGDEVFLCNNFGTVIDTFVYGSSPYSGTGWEGPAAKQVKEGRVAKRAIHPPYQDTNSSADWEALRPYGIAQSDMWVENFTVSGNITLFVSPDSSFDAIVAVIDQAQDSIFINIYEFTNTHMLDRLLVAMDRGVEVKLFLEGAPVGSINRTEIFIARQIVENGGEVRLLTNDPDNGIHQRYDYDHAKYMVVDNSTLVIMSENWGCSGVPLTGECGNRGWGTAIEDEPLAKHFAELFFTDWDPRMKDSVAFDQSHPKWDEGGNYSSERGAYDVVFDSMRITSTAIMAPVIVPDTALLGQTVLGALANAQERVLVQQFYADMHWGDKETGSVEDTPNLYMEAVIDAARRGCVVRVLLDASDYNTEEEDLLDNDNTVEYVNGIAIAEGLDLEAKLVNMIEHDFYKIHNKGFIADDRVLVSSINWNLNSVTENRETGLIIQNGEVANYFAEVFEYDWCDDLTPPTAHFTVNETYLVNETVAFNASGSSDNVGIVNYTWILDGNYVSNQLNWSVNFPGPGDHHVDLTVNDAWGNADSHNANFSVVLQASSDTTGDNNTDNTDQTDETNLETDGNALLLLGVLLLVPIFIVVVVLYVARMRTR